MYIIIGINFCPKIDTPKACAPAAPPPLQRVGGLVLNPPRCPKRTSASNNTPAVILGGSPFFPEPDN